MTARKHHFAVKYWGRQCDANFMTVATIGVSFSYNDCRYNDSHCNTMTLLMCAVATHPSVCRSGYNRVWIVVMDTTFSSISLSAYSSIWNLTLPQTLHPLCGVYIPLKGSTKTGTVQPSFAIVYYFKMYYFPHDFGIQNALSKHDDL
ncbi:hypothetical protein J6590_043728 [Homalodisca vitripennis]|nr:hypothetical protein J6590_043728 [Homalodisca vitripennis]